MIGLFLGEKIPKESRQNHVVKKKIKFSDILIKN